MPERAIACEGSESSGNARFLVDFCELLLPSSVQLFHVKHVSSEARSSFREHVEASSESGKDHEECFSKVTCELSKSDFSNL